MINGFITLKRILVALVFIVVSTMVYLNHNIKPISIKVLNHILSDYRITVINLDSQWVSINQLKIPRLILQIEDSYVAVQGFELTLTDTLAVLQKQSLYTEDIVKLQSKEVYIDLGASFFDRQQSSQSSARWQDIFKRIPQVKLEKIQIRLPAQADTRAAMRPSLLIDSFSISEQGEVSSKWLFNQNELFSLTAQITEQQLSLETELDLTQSIKGLNALSNYLTDSVSTLNQLNKPLNDSSVLVELQQQLAQTITTVNDLPVNIKGQWHSSTTINLLSTELYSNNHFKNFSLLWPELPDIPIVLPESFQIVLEIKQHKMPVSLSGETATRYGAKITIDELQQQISINKAQLQQLTQRYLSKEQSFKVKKLVTELTPPSHNVTQSELAKILDFTLVLPQKSTIWYEISNDDNAAPAALFTPQVIVKVAGLNLEHKIVFADLKANLSGEIRFDHVSKLNAQNQLDLLPLIQFIEAPNQTRLNRLQLEQFNLGLSTHFERRYLAEHNQFEHQLTINPGSTLTIIDLQLSQSYLANANQEVQQQFNAKEITFSFDQRSKVSFTNTGFNTLISPFNVDFRQIEAINTVKSSQLKATQQTLRIDHLQHAWQSAISLDSSTLNKIVDSGLITDVSAQIVSQAKDIKLTKTQNNYRKQTLLNLNDIVLEQSVTATNGVIHSTDQWQVNNIEASSQHFIQPSSKSVAGQWKMSTDISSFLPTLAKNQSVPPELIIDGHLAIESSFSFSEVNGNQQFELIAQPQITHVQLEFNDSFIQNAQLQTQCKFNWNHHHSKTLSISKLECPETLINIAKGRAGLLFNDLTITSDIKLGMDDSKPLNSWLQKLTGLSDSDVKMTLQGETLDGQFLIPEFVLKLHEKSHGYLLLQKLSVAELLAQLPPLGVYANGLFDGVLPVEFIDKQFTISGGQLAARAPGGKINVPNNEAIEQLKQTQPYLELVFDALAPLNYQQLSGNLDMQANGDAQIDITIKGKSPNVERPIELHYQHQENLIQLYRSTQIGNQLQSNIEQSVQ
ncbi:YdbH domain-containing protein [Shewanella gaetbuli]|uniref:YdbH domain-containing protein n=1 Tax=Shewanella gaetbuli TaxID=220752 RepID=A0A9X2CKF7_9GAMM|nr:YdbH domain-containing protein [Shewanella gaetbuli]MCL1143056.1 YdbH domain-containing protein [Shewanella gaetbuli]